MPKHPSRPLYALLVEGGWSQPEIDVAQASVRGQVSQVLHAASLEAVDEPTLAKLKAGTVLVITSPIECAAYSVRAMRRAAGKNTRVVRAYGPEGQTNAAALWLNMAGATSGSDLDWRRDSERFAANEANVRVWLRADEVGIAPCPDRFSRPRYLADGVRARLVQGLAVVRGQLGQLKRAAYLAKQRRSMRQS